MLGKTNVCNLSSGGDIVTVINKTGVTINQGDKVWINKYVYLAGSTLGIKSNYQLGYAGQYGAFINRDGTFAHIDDNDYTILGDSIIQNPKRGSPGVRLQIPIYGPNNSIFFSNYGRFDQKVFYKLYNPSLYAGEDYFVSFYNYKITIQKFDIETGKILKEYDPITTTFTPKHAVVVPHDDGIDYIYCLISGKYLIVKINNNTEEVVLGTEGEFSGLLDRDKPIFVTSDKKYLINTQEFVFYDISNPDEIRYILNTDIPTELFDIYGKSFTYTTFNPYNDILVLNNYTSYYILKYISGTGFKLLPIELPITSGFDSAITFSDDLSKCCYLPRNSNVAKIVNLTTKAENSAVSFNYNNIMESACSGNAISNAENGEEFNVLTVLPVEVEMQISVNADNIEINVE